MGIVFNLIAYAITLAVAVRGKTIRPGLIWLTVVIVVNTIPIFLLPERDPRLLTLFPNTLAHIVLFGVARGLRKLFAK
jgi:hypothetical protein